MSLQASESRSNSTRPANRPSTRSRAGCLTCKRRKVKCDEQRPRCSHCERLNFECRWQISTGGNERRRNTRGDDSNSHSNSNSNTNILRTPVPETEPPSQGPSFQTPPFHAVNQLFDYASFMWDIGSDGVWQQLSPETAAAQGVSFDTASTVAATVSTSPHSGMPQPLITTPNFVSMNHGSSEPSTAPETTSSQMDTSGQYYSEGPSVDNHRLMDYFTHSVTPPILAEVDTQKNWLAMRQILVGMSSSSRMVRWAVLAFSHLMLSRGGADGSGVGNQQNHYQNAAAEVAACDVQDYKLQAQPSQHRTNMLAALFFLSYVDILEARIEVAHSNLKRAHNIFQHGNKDTFTPTEKQLLLWIRLLDARAVSAGGEGLFLSKDDEVLLVDAPSPNLLKEGINPDKDDVTDGDIEDALFQVLYQPGIMFFQKVQSFMGRISKIDPWHRSRGTVDDETEVLNMGKAIAADLRTLYDSRPQLMDFAVAGRLTPPHVSAHLAFVITRAFRTYLSNYFASKVHLHRVAYKTFPLTSEALDALEQIRRLTRLIVEGLDHGDALPVNMLWPLLMLGSEEQDPDERKWINTQILRMEKVAGNAKITAQVLEEVQARQDKARRDNPSENNWRVDIRSVMHAIFNRCFAIV